MFEFVFNLLVYFLKQLVHSEYYLNKYSVNFCKNLGCLKLILKQTNHLIV